MNSKQILSLIGSILFLTIAKSSGKVITFKSCGPNVIQTVDINPCDAEPCVFKKGLSESLTLTFTSSDSSITGIKAKAYGVIAGVKVPYTLPKTDGCSNCNLTCPLQPGTHVYLNDITIPKNVPNLRLVVQWILLDQSDNTILCFEFPISVTG